MANRRYIDFPIASTSGDTDIILIWQDGANKQTTKATFLSGLPENLDELNDVAIAGLTNGQILRYDSVTGKWENTDQGNLDLNDLNDVSIVSPSNGQVLVYNSSTNKWENSSAGFVPYTGAVTTVNLGAQQLIAGQTTLTTNGSTDTLTVNHTSGSGKAIKVTKGGNGEGLYINKTSGSGNAATIIGTLEATTLKKTGGTSSQFLKADGSVDSSTYGTGTVTSVGLSSATSGVTIGSSPVTSIGTITLAIATASGSQNGLLSSTDWTTFNNKQNALTNPVTGTGASGQVAYFTGTTAISSESALFWDATNDRLGIGLNNPSSLLHIFGAGSGNSLTYTKYTCGDGGDIRVGKESGVNNDAIFGTWSNNSVVFYSNSLPRLTIANSGAATFLNNVNQNFNDGGFNFYKSDGTTLKAFIGNLNGTTTDEGYLGLYKTNVQKVAIRASGTSYLDGGNVLIGNQTDFGFKLDVNGTARFSDGTQGLIVRAYTGADGWGAIYPVGVTPSGTNYSLIARSTNAVLNASTSVTLAVGDSGKLTANSTGISVNGTYILNGTFTFTSSVQVSGSFQSGATTPYWQFQSTTAGATGYIGFGNSLISGSAATDFILRSDNALRFASGATTALAIATNSSATFTSSVTSSLFGFNALASYGFTSYAGSSASGSNITFTTNYYGGIDAIYQSSGNTNDFGIWTNGGASNAAKLYIKNSGNVLIGTTTDNLHKLRVNGDLWVDGVYKVPVSSYFICGSAGYRFNNSTDAFNNFIALDNGNATLRGTLTQNASDERLKNNIEIIPNAIDKIKQLRGVTFKWNQELYETSRKFDIGVIAQEVEQVLPNAVCLAPFDTNFDDNTSKSGQNYLTVYYEKLIPLLIEGIKELKQEIDTLKN